MEVAPRPKNGSWNNLLINWSPGCCASYIFSEGLPGSENCIFAFVRAEETNETSEISWCNLQHSEVLARALALYGSSWLGIENDISKNTLNFLLYWFLAHCPLIFSFQSPHSSSGHLPFIHNKQKDFKDRNFLLETNKHSRDEFNYYIRSLLVGIT